MTPETIWQHWNLNPLFLTMMLFPAWLYSRAVWRLWARVRVGVVVTRWQFGAFWIGLLALMLALFSPIDPLGDVLFAAHMTQHMLMIIVAAPLMVMGISGGALAWTVPRAFRRPVLSKWHQQRALRTVWRWLTHPVSAWGIFFGVVWLWHLPALYQAALQNALLHEIEHLSFILAALLFWWVVKRTHPLKAILMCFTTGLHVGVLGALLTFSQALWYPVYSTSALGWGLSPSEDQQLAGLVMWIPGGVVLVGAALAVLFAYLRDTPEKQSLIHSE